MENDVSDLAKFEQLLNAWDRMQGSVQRVLTSQPFQMTEAAARMDAERLSFNALIQRIAFPERTSETPPAATEEGR